MHCPYKSERHAKVRKKSDICKQLHPKITIFVKNLVFLTPYRKNLRPILANVHYFL